MAKRKKPAVSAADELEAVPSLRSGPVNWFDALDEPVRREMLEIRRRYRLNACGGKSMDQVRSWCMSRWGFKVGRYSWTQWLRADDDQAKDGGRRA